MSIEQLQEKVRATSLQYESLLAQVGYSNVDMVNLRRVFLLALRDVYYTERNFDSNELKRDPVRWRKDVTERTIDIELDHLSDPNNVAPRPAIYIGFTNVNFNRMVIGDHEGFSEDNSTEYLECMAATEFVLRHVSNAPDFSYMLGNHSLAMFLLLRKHFLSEIPSLSDVRPLQISGIKLVQKDDRREYQVDVRLALTLNHGWAQHQEGHRLKEVGLTTEPSADLSHLVGLAYRQST